MSISPCRARRFVSSVTRCQSPIYTSRHLFRRRRARRLRCYAAQHGELAQRRRRRHARRGWLDCFAAMPREYLGEAGSATLSESSNFCRSGRLGASALKIYRRSSRISDAAPRVDFDGSALLRDIALPPTCHYHFSRCRCQRRVEHAASRARRRRGAGDAESFFGDLSPLADSPPLFRQPRSLLTLCFRAGSPDFASIEIRTFRSAADLPFTIDDAWARSRCR